MTTPPRRPLGIAIVGAGGVAAAFVRALRSDERTGVRVVGVVARSPAGRERIRRAAPGVRLTGRLGPASLDGADVIALAVPDDAVTEVAATVAATAAPMRGRVVLHHAGAMGADALEAPRIAGADVAVLHPLCALPRAGAPVLSGAAARVEGTPRGIVAARRIARAVGLRVLGRTLWDDADRARYHAAAAIASNDVAALILAATSRLERLGIDRTAASDAVLHLARGAVEAVARDGADGLTGPVVRGDLETVRRHADALDDDDALRAAHLSTLRASVEIAERAGRLDPELSRTLRRALRRLA